MPEPRFLTVRLGSLGDIVHTFPAVAGLRESFPEAEILWLTHPRWKALVENRNSLVPIPTRNYRTNPQKKVLGGNRLPRAVEVRVAAILRRRSTQNRILVPNSS